MKRYSSYLEFIHFQRLQASFETNGAITQRTPQTYSLEDMERLYSLGSSYYSAGNYTASKAIFQLLILARPFQKQFWFGLACSQQMEGDFENAIVSWSMNSLIDENDPSIHLHCAEALFSLSRTELALQALAHARQLLEEGAPLSEPLKNRLEALEEAWKVLV